MASRWLPTGALAAACLLASSSACERSAPPASAGLALTELMSASADQRFARALEAVELRFPRDHGPHFEFQSEWWYFTANLRDAAGAEFGCQLTFFRRATRFEASSSSSRWSARDVYMAHFALSDVGAGRFRAFERLERGALELAGARLEPDWRVWLRDWSASGELAPGAVARLSAEQDGVRLALELQSLTEPVLHGERGLSLKGDGPGAASYYYSLPRMEARGVLALNGALHEVRGLAWFDREWSTSALDEDQVGWDWFALRLGDAGELMAYSLRRRDGARDPHDHAVLIARDGSTRRLRAADFSIEALEHWTSPSSAVRYPARWRVRVPAQGIELEVRPLIAAQELELSVRYWEGAVRVTGSAQGASVDARGYVELAGY